jgi:hypothetical protein
MGSISNMGEDVMTVRNFTPVDWYWRKDDGSTWSSSLGRLLKKNEPGPESWTVWPRDENGDQTNDALAAVLAPYGLTMDGKPPTTLMPFLSFLSLFTADEQAAIVSSDDPRIRLFCLMAAGASGVDLSDPRTVAGTQQLEALKLIGKGRAKQVLSGQAPPEAPTTQTAA